MPAPARLPRRAIRAAASVAAAPPARPTRVVLRLAAGLVAGAGLAALAPRAEAAGAGAPGTRVWNIQVERVYTGAQATALGDPAAVVVFGAPPDGAGPAEVAAALRMPAHAGGGGFAAISPPVPRQENVRRLVLAFGGAGVAARLCERGPDWRAGAAASGRIEGSAAFCNGPNALSSLNFAVTGVAGPSDPGFAQAMRVVVGQALPVASRQIVPRP